MLLGREWLTRVISGKQRVIHSILIVEDEPLVAFDTEHVLVQAGYSVAATVDNYDHAIAAIEAGGVDLIVADVNLRGDRNGVDVARFAQDLAIPVLFVTGACPIEAPALAIGCLAKPYSQRDLLQALVVADAIVRAARPPRLPAGMRLFQSLA